MKCSNATDKSRIPIFKDYDQDIRDFGSKMRKFREESGMSLDAFSAISGVDKSALSKIENGTRVPRYDTFLRILDAFELPPEDLLPDRFSIGDSSWLQIQKAYLALSPSERASIGKYVLAMLSGLAILSDSSDMAHGVGERDTKTAKR